MFNIFSKLFDSNQKVVNKFMPVVDEVNALEEKVSKMKLEEMKERMDVFRQELKPLLEKIDESTKSSLVAIDRVKGLPQEEKDIQNKLLEFLPEVYAIVREVMNREYKKRHFDVQILAGTILAQGQKLTELKTGEGKTQVFHLPLALYGLTGRGAHAVTVNDYLARRDGEYAGHVLSKLGFTVGIITPTDSYKFISTEEIKIHKSVEDYESAKKMIIKNPGDTEGYNLLKVSKKDAYNCDIVYGTNNEFGFDYLRDNMASSLEALAQRELYFCIIDEADSILIDEARTPLIISAPAQDSNQLYQRFARIVPKLKVEEDFTIDEKAHSVMLTDVGIEKVEGMIGVQNLWQDYALAHHLENALKAQNLYKKDKEYLVKDGEVLIVDQFTGRVLAGRRYSEGLHQAIEAKEGVEVKKESKTLATITFQNFFRLYKILDGASGTIMTEAGEFFKIYNLDSVEIPTNNPVIRKDQTDRVYKNRESKFEAVKREIMRAHESGQPILVGTTSIQDSEYISKLLDNEGVQHEVLNAKFHEKESRIVAEAGRKNAVTVATNMAGRGTDIKLGGQNATDEEYKEVLDLGGLYVIGTERHEARRVDNQLRGRSGRQGEKGETRFFVALDDEIMRIQGGNIVQRIMSMTNIPDDMPIESGMIGSNIERAQKRVEGHNFDIRKRLVDYDDVMNQQRQIFYTRRRNALDLSENAKGKFMKGRDVVIEEDKTKIETYKSKIIEQVEKFVLEELKNIINTHYFSDRGDNIDAKKTIEQILDLVQDEFIAKSILSIQSQKVSVDNLVDYLSKEIEDKNQEEIFEYFEPIVKKVIELKVKDYGNGIPDVYKVVILQAMDELWTEHIELMRDLREGIGLRGYAQRDPLVEYKNESFDYFEKFISSVNSQISKRILKMVKVERVPEKNVVIETNSSQIDNISEGSREMVGNIENVLNGVRRAKQTQESSLKKVVQVEDSQFANIGRNDPCPCGSGKKFKKCHGKNS